MILLKSLKLRNFLSHEETDVEFTDNQKLLIDGNSGSGKSTILEGIIWALYGEGRTSNTALVRRGTTKMSVGLCLTNGTDIFHIERTINNGKHSLSIQINGVAHPFTGVRELQAWIENELTGASYLLFVNSIAYVQGGPDSFVTQNATKRKDLLLEIVKTINFDEYYEKTKSKISQEEKELAVHEQSIVMRQAWLTSAEETVKNKTQAEENIAKYTKIESAATSAREESVVALSKVEEKISSIKRISTDIDLINSEEKTNIATIAALTSENVSKAAQLTQEHRAKNIVEADIETIGDHIAGINQKIASVATINAQRLELFAAKPADYGWDKKAEEVNVILSNPDNRNKCSNPDCPYYKLQGEHLADCAGKYAEYTQKHGQYVAELKAWQESYDAIIVPDITPLQSELVECTAKLTALKNELTAVNALDEIKNTILANQVKIDSLTNANQTLSTKRAALQKDLDELNKSIDEAAIANHKQNIAACDATLAATRTEREANQLLLGGILDTEKKIPETKQALEDSMKLVEVTKQNLYRLGLLKDAFGSKGVKAIVIDYILPDLEEKINNILSQMSEFRVVLDTQQEKADGEGNKEGLFITIINDMGEEMPFESYSGGERLKIIVSITEALATLQRCGFRLYDETWVGLDENSLESFAKVLDNLLERFPQVICVSHLQEIKAAFEHKLFVTKHNGISRLNYE
jgi:DNA repair exonuclease SbcCD ATPase subunit